jgi:hypothetical protein
MRRAAATIRLFLTSSSISRRTKPTASINNDLLLSAQDIPIESNVNQIVLIIERYSFAIKPIAVNPAP